MDISEKIATLTPREREVLGLIAEGNRLKEVARLLHVNPSSARHVAIRVAHKLGARHPWHAAVLLLKNA